MLYFQIRAMSRENLSSGFPTRSNTNGTVQPQRIVRGFKFCTIYVAKTKALVSCVATAQLICAFDFTYAKSKFSHDTAHIIFISLYKEYSTKSGKML